MEIIKISLYELLKCISNAQDLVSPLLANHHQKVAYLSYCLAKEMGLPVSEQKDIFLAALVHDIGALSMNERLDVIEKEPMTVNSHAFIGAKILSDFKPLQNSADIIKYHHLSWNIGCGMKYKGEDVPFGSHLIHLADRACTLIDPNRNVLTQVPQILENIRSNTGTLFEPLTSKAFEKVSAREYVWLDLVSSEPIKRVNTSMFDIVELEIDDIIDLAAIFSHIIDFRSSFTARHSAGVAKTAERLACMFGFPSEQCKMMLVAGYLHDLGKLAVPNMILEKPAKLSEDEFNEIRMHTYHTYHLLNTIPQLNEIKTWAAYHHERIDGRGYPFHIKGDDLSVGARIMAVSDVFTAIMEDRPYRSGMSDATAKKVLKDLVSSGALDPQVVDALIENFDDINQKREISQKKASVYYENYLKD